MTNLIEVAEELEFVPKESLIEMAQNPNSRFPSYMVLSEIQRRTQMEKMYNAARMERPETTVAQELVGEFSQPQGLAGAMTDDLGRLPNNFSDSVAPANSLMQMANGGLTGSDAIRQAETSLGGEPSFSEIAASYNENQRLIREQEAEKRRIEAERIFGGLEKSEPSGDMVYDFFFPESDQTMDEWRQSNREAVDRFFGGSETEDNIFERAGSAISTGLKNRYYDDEGDFNYGTAATDALMAVPGGIGLRGGILLLSKLLRARKAAQAAKNTFVGPVTKQTLIGSGALAAGLYGKSLLDDETDTTTQITTGGDGAGGRGTGGGGTGEGGKDKGDDGKKKDGLLGKIDPLDIAKLGGIILGAKGTGDIGQGITALASDVQQRRSAQQERLADEAYRQLQGDYLKSQKRMLDINIANAPTDLLINQVKQFTSAYKNIVEQRGPDDAQAMEIALYLSEIAKELRQKRNVDLNTGQTNPEKQVQSFISEAP